MNTFANAVINQAARTENGMLARQSTANALTDLFFKIGAMRGKNVIPSWTAAFVQDSGLATRIALWARDARGGAGERQIFRDILTNLVYADANIARAVMTKIPELGRWDDMLVFADTVLEAEAFDMILEALNANNGLCAKWMPRQGKIAFKLRNHFGWSPKFYRKRLVELTKVVEQKMCAKEWNDINFSHVPSLAAARYKKAFFRNATEAYTAYVSELVKAPEDRTVDVKINAGAVYPYDVLKGMINHWGTRNKTEADAVKAQWEALPNFVGDANILPLVDVSGSMTSPIGGSRGANATTCLDVAVSLGLYLADKNEGKFKDTFLTFSSSPQLLNLKGDIIQKIDQMVKSKWEMDTNLHAALDKILTTARAHGVPQDEMPEVLLILSDMQFNQCATFDDSAMRMITRKYEEAGYTVPKIVFWNLNAHDNVPVKYDERGVALISGFSPSIMKAVLSGDTEQFTPEAIMLKTIMNPRYDVAA